MSEYDDEDALSLMTPEEREAMKEYEEDDKANAAGLPVGGGEIDTTDEDDGSADIEEAGEADATPAMVEDEPEERPKATDSVPEFSDKDQARVNAIKAEIASLEEKFNEGDLDLEAFRKAKEPLIAEDKNLDKKFDRWNEAVETDGKAYDAVVAKFLDANPEIGATTESLHHYDKIVRELSSLATFNAMTDRKFLAEALRIAKEADPALYRPKPKEKAPGEAGKAKPKGNTHPADRARKELADTPLPLLAKLPAAAESEAGEGAFAWLNSLSGVALDDAVAKLSEEQQNEWLKSL